MTIIPELVRTSCITPCDSNIKISYKNNCKNNLSEAAVSSEDG